MWISIKEATARGLCQSCNFYQGNKKIGMCAYHKLPSLNYRNVPAGRCALRLDERKNR